MHISNTQFAMSKEAATMKTKGKPLTAANRKRVDALVRTLGEGGAAERLGISRSSLARAAGGLPLYPGTLALIEAGLASLTPQVVS